MPVDALRYRVAGSKPGKESARLKRRQTIIAGNTPFEGGACFEGALH